MTYRLMVQKSGSCVAPVGIIYQPCSRKSWKTTRPSSSAIICLTFSWWAIVDLGGGFWQILHVYLYMGVSRLHDVHDMSMTLVETSRNDQFGSNCVLTELTVLLCFFLYRVMRYHHLKPTLSLAGKGNDSAKDPCAPRCSMYGLFVYIWVVLENVGIVNRRYWVNWAFGIVIIH